jgi:hypothetical protein
MRSPHEAAGEEVAMPRKREVKSEKKSVVPIVTFDFENRTYEIDPGQRKVYRRFVEIETSRAAEIFSVWRARHA